MGYYGYNVGDPGFFSWLGGAFKTIGRGLAGAAKGIAKGAGFVGQGLVSAIPTIAQIGAPIVGSVLGGPIGGFAGGALGNLLGGGASGNAIPDYPATSNYHAYSTYATPFSSAGAPIPAAWEIPDTRPPIDMAYTETYRDEPPYEEEDYEDYEELYA